MRAAALLMLASLAGCAMQPMSPEQAAYIRQMQLEQQRAYNQQQLEAQRVLMNPRGGAVQPVYQQVQPQGVSAYWTGRSNMAQSVTGATGFNCEYNYAGRTFWRMFSSSCPSSVQVQ